MSLHTTFHASDVVRGRIQTWDAETRREADLPSTSWQIAAIWSQARSATIAASTAIEGNPLTQAQVDEVLAGGRVEAAGPAIREIENYSEAMNVAARAADRGFEWSEDVIAEINASITRALDPDTRGRYRVEGVRVGIYEAPHELAVPALMRDLVGWLRVSDEPPLIRSALVHLNLIAIHPFADGNGRTARVLSSLELMRSGLRAPELLAVESYLRAHRAAYIDELRVTLGTSYDPDNHPATRWVDWYTAMSVDRLDARQRVRDAMPNDIGLIGRALDEAGEPLTWLTILLAAAIAPVRTTPMARLTGVQPVSLRPQLARMAAAGWLVSTGTTRDRRYEAGPRLAALPLRTPAVWQSARSGEAAEDLPG